MLLREGKWGYWAGFISSLKITTKIVATESEGVRNSICCHVHQVKMKVWRGLFVEQGWHFHVIEYFKRFFSYGNPRPKHRKFESCSIFSRFPCPFVNFGVGKILVETFYLLIAQNLPYTYTYTFLENLFLLE